MSRHLPSLLWLVLGLGDVLKQTLQRGHRLSLRVNPKGVWDDLGMPAFIFSVTATVTTYFLTVCVPWGLNHCDTVAYVTKGT